jgi:alpha-tubulin suppressor-like RCC1 family protein
MKNRASFFLFFLSVALLFLTADASWAGAPKISAGWFHTVVLRSDGTLWAWGANVSGQLGDGTRVPKSSPIQIGSERWDEPAKN